MPADVIIGVSASDRTPYVIGALERARETGALTIALVSTSNSPLAKLAEHVIEVLSGPEAVSGSTRMKAGTAQKPVLNAISALTMVQLGHTLGDLMVGVRATNVKLQRRVHRIVAEVTGAYEAAVAAAVAATGGAANPAVVMLLAGVDANEARRRLAAADGHVRRFVNPAAAAALR